MAVFRLVFLSLLAVAAVAWPAHSHTAGTVYVNARIYTVNKEQPWAEAVAIKDGEFLVVGSKADVDAVTGEDTKVVDLNGQFVMPGFHDTHVHIEQAYIGDMVGEALLSFPPDPSIETMQELLKSTPKRIRNSRSCSLRVCRLRPFRTLRQRKTSSTKSLPIVPC